MAPPPRYLITRRLVKRFFNSYLPRQPLNQVDEEARLFECWEVHGIDNPKCKELVVLFDQQMEKSMNYRKRVMNLRLEEQVMATLKKPRYNSLLKGRFKSRNPFGPETIYDGVKEHEPK